MDVVTKAESVLDVAGVAGTGQRAGLGRRAILTDTSYNQGQTSSPAAPATSDNKLLPPRNRFWLII